MTVGIGVEYKLFKRKTAHGCLSHPWGKKISQGKVVQRDPGQNILWEVATPIDSEMGKL